MAKERNPLRKLELAARRERQLSRIPNYAGHDAPTLAERSEAWVAATKQGPNGKRGPSLMKQSNRLAGMRHIIKNAPERIKETNLVTSIRLGTATRQAIYGFHPTKGDRRAKNRR